MHRFHFVWLTTAVMCCSLHYLTPSPFFLVAASLKLNAFHFTVNCGSRCCNIALIMMFCTAIVMQATDISGNFMTALNLLVLYYNAYARRNCPYVPFRGELERSTAVSCPASMSRRRQSPPSTFIAMDTIV